MKIRKSEEPIVFFGVIAVLITLFVVIVLPPTFLNNILNKNQGAEGSDMLNIKTRHHKELSESEWKHFHYAVSECRAVIKESLFLQERADFWEIHGIEPEVGYTAWLFQESRFDGDTIGDNGRAHGYGQIHPPALSEMNLIRKERGDRVFSHQELVGKSRERLRFFLHSIHDYGSLCPRNADKNLDLKLNFWNGGCSGGSATETVHSGRIKSFILQYYKRKQGKH